MRGARRYVYVLRQLHEEHYYVGVTSDPGERLIRHNEGRTRHTNRLGGPWTVHVLIEFELETTALRFEKYLKSGSGRAFAKRHFG